MRERLADSVASFRSVARNPGLRRLELAAVGSVLGGWSYSIAISVFAFESGGTTAVGVVALARWLPAAAAAPWTSILGDRLSRRRVMLAADLVRAALMSAMAVTALSGGPTLVVYTLAACSAVAGTAFRPAQSALVPSLARTPEELTAANVVSSTIESLGIFAGPALGGLLLAATSAGVVFACVAVAFLWSALNVARLPDTAAPEPSAGTGIVAELLAGFRAIARAGHARLLIGLFAGQTLVDGALGVLVVTLALDHLGLGPAGVGFLNAAGGIGGLVGAVVAAGLIGRRRLGGDFGVGLAFWGLPIALIGVWPNEWLALVLLGVTGAANTVVDVAGMTLLQRSAPDEVLARVFGVLESVILGASALGAVLAPVVYHSLGLQGALIIVGAILPVAALVSAPALRALDSAAHVPLPELELLRSVPFLEVLPPQALELLAGRAARVEFSAGELVFREGDHGDRFYVIAEGEVEIAGRRHGPGGYFGEIALLTDVPRTASVRAVTQLGLVALDRDHFIAAVTGHAPSEAAADVVVGARLSATITG